MNPEFQLTQWMSQPSTVQAERLAETTYTAYAVTMGFAESLPWDSLSQPEQRCWKIATLHARTCDYHYLEGGLERRIRALQSEFLETE